nr:hypothetical protein GCM10020093_021730 [Planobispora longispora]
MTTPEAQRPPGTVLEAVLERITYANEETGYTIARVATERSGSDLLTVVGPLLGAQVGESLRLTGRWGSHPRYGRQFEVWSYTTVLPATVQGIQRYLGSGLIKGIGPKMAERIVDHFGTDTLEIIETAPERLVEVPGLGPKRTKMIGVAWEEQKIIKEVMIFLQGVGVSTSIAVRIFKQYGDASISVVKNEPYRLADDVWGIGFKTADTIAQAVGIPHDSPERVKAGLRYTLSQGADDGHCYLPAPNLIADAVKILQVPAELVASCLEELVAEGVVREDLPAGDNTIPAIYLVPFHRAELSLAGSLRSLLRSSHDRMGVFQSVDWDVALEWLRGRTGADLAQEQSQAVRLALTEKVAVLTGGPGCGKSFTVRSIVTLARAKKAKVILAAPTGRAAKRLAELTGHEATTVHRLLQLRPGVTPPSIGTIRWRRIWWWWTRRRCWICCWPTSWSRRSRRGRTCCSWGMSTSCRRWGRGGVAGSAGGGGGDSAGAADAHLPAGAGVGVVTNAHRVNTGLPPALEGMKDFFLFPCEEPEEIAALTVDVVANRIPRKFGLDARRDVQVLAPMHRGAAGAGNLNLLLQEALTPSREGLPERRYGGRVFRIGDKVTQLRNNYDKGAAGVFNGTVGVVVDVRPDDHKLVVRTDEDEDVDYSFDELDELAHAYAVSIHRSQGSEYPAVVIPLATSAWMMLQRNLLYTAITRAKKLVVIVGSRRALGQAVRTRVRGAGTRV